MLKTKNNMTRPKPKIPKMFLEWVVAPLALSAVAAFGRWAQNRVNSTVRAFERGASGLVRIADYLEGK